MSQLIKILEELFEPEYDNEGNIFMSSKEVVADKKDYPGLVAKISQQIEANMNKKHEV